MTMNDQDLRKYINIINENAIEKDELDEQGGLVDVGLAKLGSRAARGRVERKQTYKDMLGDWREYAARLGIDQSRWFSQKRFPRGEFVDFLRSQYGFDDEMVDAIGIGRRAKADVKTVFTKAADVLLRKEARAGLGAKRKPTPTSKFDTRGPSTVKSTRAGREQQADEVEAFMKRLRGNIGSAVSQAKEAAGDGEKLAALNDLEKLGFALLKIRGKI